MYNFSNTKIKNWKTIKLKLKAWKKKLEKERQKGSTSEDKIKKTIKETLLIETRIKEFSVGTG